MNGSTAFGYFWRNKSIVVAISNGEIFSMDPAAMLRIPQDDKELIVNVLVIKIPACAGMTVKWCGDDDSI